MSRVIYDIALLVGVLLIGGGVYMWSFPAALVTVGALVIALTLIGVWLFKP